MNQCSIQEKREEKDSLCWYISLLGLAMLSVEFMVFEEMHYSETSFVLVTQFTYDC